MGILRVFLALTVCLNHYFALPNFSKYLPFGLGAPLSVDVFFTISGFYMALILKKKYTGPGSIKKFYLNRFLRLYPSYYLIAIAYLALSVYLRMSKGHWVFMTEKVNIFAVSDYFTHLYALLANIFIFGQDSLFFLQFSPGTTTLAVGNPIPGAPCYPWQMLIIPQAWSIDIELMFYLLAPLFLRWRTRTIAFIVIILLLTKFYMQFFLYLDEYWIYRFPPIEVAHFLMGILAYRIYSYIELRKISFIYLALPFVVFLAYMSIFPLIPGLYAKSYATYPLALFCVPAIFKLTKKISIDRVIGELSYPVYLMHNIIYVIVLYSYRGSYVIAISVALTIIFSFLLHHYFLRPIEAYRQRQVYTPS